MVRFFRSLRFRLIILAVTALLPALAVLLHSSLEARRQATAAAEDQLRQLVTLVVREQEQKTMAARQLLMGLAQAPAVRRQEAEVCSALFARPISRPSLFINIGAIDRDGNMFASGVPMPGPLNTSHRQYFQKAMKTREFAVGNLQIGRIVKKPVLLFSYPVLDAAGEVQTVLYASVGLDWLHELAAQARLPEDSVLVIIDEPGTIMAKYPDPGKWAGKGLPPGGLIDIMQKRGEGMAEAQGMDGVPRVYAFTPLGGEPRLGFVYAGIPLGVVYGAADQAMRRNLALLGGVLLLALGLAWGFGYLFIMRRINPLVQAAARLAAGDLAVRTGLTGGPEELGRLAQAFDQMAASLEAQEAERRQAEAALQQRVHDLATLHAASRAFLGQIEVAATSQATCRLAVEHFGVRMAWVGLIRPGDYLVHPAASFGAEAGYLDAVRITWDDRSTGRGPTGTAIRTRQPFIMHDIETDAAFGPWREAAQARGYRSSVAVPLCLGDEVLGALNLFSEQADFFQADRVQVLQAFANQAAVALQKARLYEETKRDAAELADRVAERTAQLESTNLELDRFAYSVSHDLRAPLRGMQGFSQALLEDYAGELDPGGQDFARRINAAAERMDQLIQDLLAHSRLSREEMALQPVSLEQAAAALAHLEGDISARQARVRVEPPLPEVQAHRATLLQIVANLVSNAIKFTAPGVKPQVRLRAEDRGEQVRLWVEDNGLGIAPEHQERIFRIFERLHGVEAYPGTGIGLAIVKKSVERMGGQVGVESAPGQGSRFWVDLAKAV